MGWGQSTRSKPPAKTPAKPAAGVKVEAIAAEAEVTTNLLDNAVSKIRNYQPSDVAKYLEELAHIRGLLQKIRYQEDLQILPVATAFAPLKAVMKRLSEAGSDGFQQLANIMDEVRQAGLNLRQRLPGVFSSAVNNEANKASQINAAVGAARPDGRLTTEALGNKATDASQINAPMFGDIAALTQFMQGMQGRANKG